MTDQRWPAVASILGLTFLLPTVSSTFASAQACPPTTAVGGLGIASGLVAGVGGGCGGGSSSGGSTPGQPPIVQTGTGSGTGTSGSGASSGSSGGNTAPEPPTLNPVLCTTPAEFNNPPPGTYCGTNQPNLNPTGSGGPGTSGPASGGGNGPPAAAPPTGGQVWARVPLPPPRCEYNPATTGLTGLATWGWAAPSGPVTANPSINGYSVQAQARPIRYIWEWGDGASSSSASPGAPTAPAVSHTYRTKEDYTISCRVVWTGTYTFTGPGGAIETVDLGTTAMRQDLAYHVVEVRSVLVAPER